MMTRLRHSRRQTGFGLLELMIALALGVLVIGGIIQVFYSTSQTYRMQQAMSRVQETGRYVLDFMQPEVRRSGRMHFCTTVGTINNLLDTGSGDYDIDLHDPTVSITAYNFNGTDIGSDYNLPATLDAGVASAGSWTSSQNNPLPQVIADLAIPGSDVLLVKAAVQINGLTVCGGNPIDGSSLSVNYKNNGACGVIPDSGLDVTAMTGLLPQDSLILATDCTTGGDFFQRANVADSNLLSRNGGSSPGNVNAAGTNWSKAYSNAFPTSIYRINTTAYFIGENAVGSPSLYRMNMGLNTSAPVAEELAEGVESMQVLLGVAVNAAGQMQYVEPDQVTAIGTLANIVSVRVSYLVRSEANADLEIDDQTFNVAGTTIDPVDDSRLRRVFDSVIGFRNRIGS